MEYKILIADFAERTLVNLDHVQEQVARGNKGAFEVTQLRNSLLGLIVAPHEREMRRIPTTRMNRLCAQDWPRLTTGGKDPKTLRDLLRKLRNAVAHFNVEFIADTDPDSVRRITSVKVWNQTTSGARDKTWEGEISVEALDRLARKIAKVYLEQFARRCRRHRRGRARTVTATPANRRTCRELGCGR